MIILIRCLIFQIYKKKERQMKKLLVMLVLALLATGCIYVAKEEAEKECDKAGEKCESVSESDLNS